MGWKKSRLVQKAYGAFGLQAMAFSLTPEMQGDACDILDAMMAAWGTQYGIRIGYNNGSNSATGVPNPDQDSNLPDHANEAVYLGLADRLADTIGKQLSVRMVIRGQLTFDTLVSWCQSNSIPNMQYRRNTPSGAGNKPYQTGASPIFIQSPVDQLETGADGFLDGDGGAPLNP